MADEEKFLVKFSITVDGEIWITKSEQTPTQEVAENTVQYMDAHTLLDHVTVDDPYENRVVDIFRNSDPEPGDDYDDEYDEEIEYVDTEDDEYWPDSRFPDNDLLDDQSVDSDPYDTDTDGQGF